jgi:hypothetical protein
MVLFVLGSAAYALSVPQTMNFTGYLTDSGIEPLNDNVEIAFSFYDGPDAEATILWNETVNVIVEFGFFSHVIGSNGVPLPPSIFDTDGTIYLGLNVNGEDLMPRFIIASVPYAMWAGNALSEADIRAALTANLVPANCADGQISQWEAASSTWTCTDGVAGLAGVQGEQGLIGPEGPAGPAGPAGP